MKLPPNHTEAEVLSIIDNVVNRLSPTLAFGMYDLDDIRQEARLLALEALSRYDPSRPLENFLTVHVRNRLLNLRRDKLHRADPPCPICHTASLAGLSRTEHASGAFCERYLAWRERNGAKRSLMKPVSIEHDQGRAVDVEPALDFRELLQQIDDQLPVSLRAPYLQLRAGQRVPRALRLQVENAVRHILQPEDADAC